MLFFSNFFAFLKKWFESKFGYKEGYYIESNANQNIIDVEYKEKEQKEEKLLASRRTILTALYQLKQEIEIFRLDFPDRYKQFLATIDSYESEYEKELRESKELLTMTVDPEENQMKWVRVEQLSDEIEDFINGEVRARSVLKKIQILIVKTNILYNESILHSKESDKEKVMRQLEKVRKSELDIVKEVCENSFLVRNIRKKEEMITLFSYEDYIIFKTALRNSQASCQELLDQMVMRTEFEDFDYVRSIKAFLNDELSDLERLINKVSNFSKSSILYNEFEKIHKLLILNEFEILECDATFWNSYQLFESNVIAFLRDEGYDSKVAKVQLLDKLHIDVSEDTLLTSPKSNAYLALVNVLHQTSNEKIYLLSRIVEQLRNDVSYKDIYFLILLFDSLDLMKSSHNGLTIYLEKYDEKFHYGKKEVAQKKEIILKQIYPRSNYALIFKDAEEAVVKAMEECQLDIKVEQGNVYLNMVYFDGLNVKSSFQTKLI